MARTKGGPRAHARHKKILKLAKGYRNRHSKCYRIALNRVEKGLKYAYRDRRAKKREFRSLWIMRINAAVRTYGLTYSKFMGAVLKANIGLDRKIMADMAMNDAAGFKVIVEAAKKQLAA
jgi:large subunit ribosomal protein L20